jgi:hypothetical protein
MSAHRAIALPEASSPGVSATLIASCRAEPFEYASMSLDCQPAAVAERRRAEWAIKAIRPARTATPSRIHSHRRLVPEPEPVAAADGEVAGAGVVAGGAAVAVTVAVAVDVAVSVAVDVAVAVAVVVAVLVTPGVALVVAVLLGRLLIALWAVLPHPAARHPATSTTTGRQNPFVEHRMSVLPPRSRSAAGPQDPREK